jgi:hypothetical protein
MNEAPNMKTWRTTTKKETIVMKKIIWIPIIIIALGVIMAWVGCAAGGVRGYWIDRGGVHMSSAERSKLVEVDESFSGFTDIDVNADFFDSIVLKKGDGYTAKGQNYERYGGLDVKLDGSTLVVEARQQKIWNINFGIDELFNGLSKNTWIEITYPAGTKLGSVNVNASSANIDVSGLDCKDLSMNDSFGNVGVSAINCDSLRLDADSGRVSVKGAVVSGNAVITDSFGDVELTDIQAGNLSAELNSGKVVIENASAGSFTVQNDFGKAEINEAEADSMTLTLSSGELTADNIKTGDLTVNSSFGNIAFDRLVFSRQCKIDNSSGDVSLGLLMSEDDLSYELHVDAGTVKVGDKKSEGSVSSRNAGATASLNVDADFGNVKLRFLR